MQHIVDSLSLMGGYHMYYLIFNQNNKFHIHPVPFGLSINHNYIVGVFKNIMGFKELHNHQHIIFALYLDILSRDNNKTINIPQIECDINNMDLILNPNIVEVFQYNMHDTFGDDTTIIINGVKHWDNQLIVTVSKLHDVDTFNMFAPSFSLKLN